MLKDKEYTIPEITPQLSQGPDWLCKKRVMSKDHFNNTPLPPRGLHLWRYTDPANFLFEPVKKGDDINSDDFKATIAVEMENLKEGNISGLITDYAGLDINFHLSEELSKSGIIALPLSEAVDKHQELVEKHLYEQINNETGKFEAMNGALWNDGIFIYVPDNLTIEKPIHILHSTPSGGKASFHRLLIVAGSNSEFTVLDEYLGNDNDADSQETFSNGAVEIIGKEYSRVRYLNLQRHSETTSNYFTHRAKIGASANMLTVPLIFGGALSKQNFGVQLDGKGANSKMYGLLLGSQRQHYDNHTVHHHSHGLTTSDIDFRVVLKDKALSAYTGLIRIEHGAKTCEAYQENKNLLLSKGTKAETIPELEILNEDVSCSHGATIGPIDEESIFYLKSRGIKKNDAVRMIVSGFTASTLKLLPEDLKERLRSYIEKRLETI